MNQPLEVKDFSGGMTDNYLAGPGNRGQLFDNLLINNNKKPFTRFGSTVLDTPQEQVLNGVKRISFIFDHRDNIFTQSEKHVYYGQYTELSGPTSNPAFAVGTVTNHISRAFWNNHSFLVTDSFSKPIKIYKDTGGNLRLRTAGMPAIAAPVVTVGAGGANNYTYAFYYFYEYTVEGVTFQDLGPTTQVELVSSAAPEINAISIASIPVLANSTIDNYDTTNVKIEIYRTQNNGTTFTFVKQITNGTTSTTDNASDSSIVNNTLIYTTGDVLDNDTPPPAKYIHIADDVALYGWVKEDGVEIPNKIRQSIQGDPDSCPVDFFDLFPEDIYGINSFQGTFIVFCKESTYRLSGFFDEQGRNGISHLKISDTVGCVSNDSIVQTDIGLFFCSQQGFYYTDGYMVKKISRHLDELTYPSLVLTATQARNMWGSFDKIENRVWWATQKEPASNDNDTCFILDLNWGISDECSFTTASNEDSFEPTALLFKEGELYRTDTRGYTFLHTKDDVTDPRIDITVSTANWATKTIIHDYKSCAFDFGTSFVRKFVPKILGTFANESNIAIQIISINDDGKSIADLKQIRYNSNIIWGDPEIIWGDPTLIWNQTGLIEEQRMFPAQNLRCNYKQIEITNADTIVKNSDLLGLVTVNSVANTVTFVNPMSAWPGDPIDYFISFEDDNYTNKFLITARNSDSVMTFLDATSLSPNTGNYKWLLTGFRKGEKIQILSYVIHYKMLTDSQKHYHVPADTGQNS